MARVSLPTRFTPTSLPRSLALLAIFALFFACRPPTGRSFDDLQYPDPVSDVRTVQVGSVEVGYTDSGQGEQTLVLIHGLGSYLPVWKNNIPALAKDYRVIAIDLPGYGKSAKSNDFAYSMEFFAMVVQGVIEQLELGRPVLVGHSMGGQIAITHALRYPGRARALVLTSPAGLETFEDGEAKWLADAVDDDFTCKASPEAIHVRHAGNFYRMPTDARFMAEDRVSVIGGPEFPEYCRAVSRSVRAMLDEPVYDQLPEIEVPTLVLFGKADALIPNPFLHGGGTERLARRTVKRIPNAELVMLRKAGHIAQFEQFDAWNEAVLSFLGKLPEPEAVPEQAPPAEPPSAEVAEPPAPEAGSPSELDAPSDGGDSSEDPPADPDEDGEPTEAADERGASADADEGADAAAVPSERGVARSAGGAVP
ncbi:MAG: alpha/beta hydrolase [Myxococcales bacterium]|nr:alpha/beta hydrolase [Myxococcales bacterium]MCB9712229.1 alpha/beta hydrolase [Myxococcales bacterium]